MIKQCLQQNAQAVEEALARSLPPKGGLQERVVEAMEYALLGGGKRIRATLVLEFCRACGVKDNRAMPLACAVEMVHAYSLIHDDLPCMDDDDMRRGKPSCHKAFGEDIALLAGDGLPRPREPGEWSAARSLICSAKAKRSTARPSKPCTGARRGP